MQFIWTCNIYNFCTHLFPVGSIGRAVCLGIVSFVKQSLILSWRLSHSRRYFRDWNSDFCRRDQGLASWISNAAIARAFPTLTDKWTSFIKHQYINPMPYAALQFVALPFIVLPFTALPFMVILFVTSFAFCGGFQEHKLREWWKITVLID